MVPAIPLLGALPSPGPGDLMQLWWLAAGAVAGAIACWVMLGSGPIPRFDQASLAGGACGLLAGAVFAGLAWAASGDLGTLRLAGSGAAPVPVAGHGWHDDGSVWHDHRAGVGIGRSPPKLPSTESCEAAESAQRNLAG